MRLRLTVAPLLLALLAACAAGDKADVAATGTAEDEAAIRAANTSYGSLWSARDTTGLAALLADDYQDVAPDGTHHADKAAVMTMMRNEFAAMPAGIVLTVNTSFVKFLDDDVAVSGGSWSATGMPPGMASTGSWTATLRKDGETWKTVTSLAAPNIPIPPPVVDSSAAAPAPQ